MTTRDRTIRGDQRWQLLVAVLGGLLAVNCTFTIFNVALARIAGDLRTTETTLTWSITGPLLVVGVAAPVLGRLGDLRGHRRLYLVGICGSLVCAVGTAVCWNASSLIVARLFSGLGDACISASSWALLFRVFEPHERSRVMGWWALVGAGGPVIGVAIGGPIVEAYGWRWVFVGQAPLIVVAIIANIRLLPDTPKLLSGRINVGSAVALALGVGGLLLALNQGGVDGWEAPVVLLSVAASALGLVLFGVLERRSDSPLFPLEWLRRRNIMLPCAAAFAINFAYMGGFFLTPLFLEQALGYGIGVTGAMQVARPLAFALSAPIAGYLAVRTGERAAAVTGGLLMAASMVLFFGVDRGVPGAVVVLALGLSGLANGVASPSLAASVANAAEVERMGSASAALQVFSQVGVVAGIQLMQTIETVRARHGLTASFHDAYLLGAGVAVVAVVCAALVRSSGRRIVASLPAYAEVGEVPGLEAGAVGEELAAPHRVARR
jgi:EmrB/QacA subfamily drug resistance transporter